MLLICAPSESRIWSKPRYAPEFQDWSETGPGVSSATLKPWFDVPLAGFPPAPVPPQPATHATAAMAAINVENDAFEDCPDSPMRFISTSYRFCGLLWITKVSEAVARLLCLDPCQ